MGSRIQKISKYKPSIFQGSLSFNAGRGVSFAVEHPYERHVLRVLATLLIALMCSYAYFVSASVLNVIARKEAAAQTASLGSSVALLENEYYSMTAGITPSAGARLGLSPVSDTQYLHRTHTVGQAETVPSDI